MFVAVLTVPESSSRMWVAGFHRAMSLYFSSAGASGLGSRKTVPELQLVLFRGITMLLAVLPLNSTWLSAGLVHARPSVELAKSSASSRAPCGMGLRSKVSEGR